MAGEMTVSQFCSKYNFDIKDKKVMHAIANAIATPGNTNPTWNGGTMLTESQINYLISVELGQNKQEAPIDSTNFSKSNNPEPVRTYQNACDDLSADPRVVEAKRKQSEKDDPGIFGLFKLGLQQGKDILIGLYNYCFK